MQLFFNKGDIKGLTECLIYCNEKIIKKTNKELVFLCVGTDKVVGDSFGPIVGHYLRQNKYIVFGDLRKTVNGTNLEECIFQIESEYKNPYIIVIDSALGDDNMVNKIVVGKGGIKPGSALNKNNKIIGDLYINAVVGVNCNNNFEELKNAKLYNVLSLSNTVYESISKTICLNKNKIVNNYIS